MNYLLTVADHAWVSARLSQLNPLLYSAQGRWGLDLAQMLVGSESMFNRYLSERNLYKLVAVLQTTDDASTFRSAIIKRLAALTHQTVEREKEETRRTFLAMQLANVRLLNPDAYEPYVAALTETGLSNVKEAATTAERVASALTESPLATPPQQKGGGGEVASAVIVESSQFHSALESAIKALGLANYFEVKG